ncbi:MAG: HD domain-containing protein [Actinomycetota bacterium]|nr:HD domain-containing protein [Actinomycetota bacterium]
MTGEAGSSRTQPRSVSRALPYAFVAFLLLAGGAALAAAHLDRVNSLTLILMLAAVVAGLMTAGPRGGVNVSAAFIVGLLAAAFLGPLSAGAAAILSELGAAGRRKTAIRTVALVNLPASVVPGVAAAFIVRVLQPQANDTAIFYLVMSAAGLAMLALSFLIYGLVSRALSGQPLPIRHFLDTLPSAALNVALAVAGASIYLLVGLRGIVFALTAVFVFSYMAMLLERSRQRAEQYVSLSWGVLAGLMRSLDIRDRRAARHAAAVARFARDMAAKVGMDQQEQELAHTAGLLHDIGHFALSDRVAERGRTLTEEDWEAIQQHPELGADMLRDLGIYGPVAEIVLSHHERIDGRGYPRGLTADEIPEIAKIISVAEIYDTLTANDTYRTKMSSFEALRELRRVADSQLDGRYVEVLAGLLTGEGVDYRHADAADFDTELDMERRIREAGAG